MRFLGLEGNPGWRSRVTAVTRSLALGYPLWPLQGKKHYLWALPVTSTKMWDLLTLAKGGRQGRWHFRCKQNLMHLYYFARHARSLARRIVIRTLGLAEVFVIICDVP